MAVTVAMGSAFFAHRGNRIAKEALLISKRQENDRILPLTSYLMESRLKVLPGSRARIYFFLASLTNPSDSGRAITSVELKLTCNIDEDKKIIFRLAHNPDLCTQVGINISNVIHVPRKIDNNDAILGWLLFFFDAPELGYVEISTYEIIFCDARNNEVVLTPVIIREVVREEPSEK
ncbi:MAG: hypothetical protein KIT00_05920 [Rhodospirillales bacterium]|nr:hypothetical protein [Rhodospirillales bacterium]